MTWHLKCVVASVPAFSVASQHAGLLLGAPAPLWGQPTTAQAGQGVLWSLLDCSSQVGNIFVDVHVCRLVQEGVGIL